MLRSAQLVLFSGHLLCLGSCRRRLSAAPSTHMGEDPPLTRNRPKCLGFQPRRTKRSVKPLLCAVESVLFLPAVIAGHGAASCHRPGERLCSPCVLLGGCKGSYSCNNIPGCLSNIKLVILCPHVPLMTREGECTQKACADTWRITDEAQVSGRRLRFKVSRLWRPAQPLSFGWDQF